MIGVLGGWPLRPLQDVADVTLGQSPPGSTYNSSGLGMPFFQGKAEFGALKPVVRKWTTGGTKFAHEGDILISVRAPVGPTNIAPTECAIGRGLAAIKPREAVDTRFLLWALRASESILASEGTGSTFSAITGTKLKSHRVPVPPIDEQRRIVEILEDHLSRLDAADAYLDACLRRTAQVLRSAIHAQFDNLVEPLRPLPAVATIINGHTPKGLADAVRSAPLPGDIAFFKVGDMNQADGDSLHASRTYVGALDISRLGLRLAAAGTIVFPKRGGAIATNKKRTLAVDGAFDLNTMGVAPGPDVSSAYLRLFFETVDLLALADGSNVPQINTPDVASLHLPVPDLTTQERMTSAVREVGDALRRLEREVRTAGTRSGSLRRALLHAAFSGCLTGHTSDADTIEALAATPSPPGRLR